MNQNLKFVLAAVIGSALTLSAVHFLGLGGKIVRVEHIEGTNAQQTFYKDPNQAERIVALPPDFVEIAEKAIPAVVSIKSTATSRPAANRGRGGAEDLFRQFFGDDFFFEMPERGNRNNPKGYDLGSGSGVIMSDNGYIMTNYHVIKNAEDVEVTLTDNRSFKAKVIGSDPSTDLALLKIEAKNLPSMKFVNSDQVRIGEWVLAVGNPFNLNSTVTAGIVSAKGRNINILREQGGAAIESFIQTDAAINPGNSGGALINMNGGLIGINTAIASPTGSYSGYGFAVPANIVSKVMEDLLQYGVVQRGFLGINIRPVDSNLAKEKGLSLTEGVYVEQAQENSAAAKAGIQAGDVIVEVDGRKVSQPSELQEMVARRRPGDEVAVLLNRKGQLKNFKVKLRNQEGNTAFVQKSQGKMSAVLGADFESIDAKTADKLGVDSGLRVQKLRPGKLQDAGVRNGFVITHIDKVPVEKAEDVEKILADREGGVMIEGYYEGNSRKVYYAIGL